MSPRPFALLLLVSCRIGFEVATIDATGVSDDGSTADVPTQMDGATPDGAAIVCPGNYVAIDASPSRYLAIDNSTVWLTAQQTCEADGHHLVIANDAAELSLVAALLPTQNIWTGITDRKTIGTFLAVTGGAATYLPWDSSEPDLSALECTFVDGATLKLADQDCTSGRRMVCECDGNTVDPSTY